MQIGQMLGIGVWEMDWAAEIFIKCTFLESFRILNQYGSLFLPWSKKKVIATFFFSQL